MTTTPDIIPTKPRASEIIAERDKTIAELRAQLDELMAHDRERDKARAEREAKGPGKLLGKIDVYENDAPDDVIERAHLVRIGQAPVAQAKRFRTDAWIGVAFSTKLAQRLDPTIAERLKKNPDLVGRLEVPRKTAFDRGELPPEEIDQYYKQGAIIAIG